MQIQLVITGTSPQQFIQLQSVLGTLAAQVAVDEATTPVATPAKSTKKKKSEETFDLSPTEKSLDEMDSEEQAEIQDEITETAEDEQPPLKLADVIKACKADKPKALKTLAKFKVKSINDLKPTQYQKFVDALEA